MLSRRHPAFLEFIVWLGRETLISNNNHTDLYTITICVKCPEREVESSVKIYNGY